MSEWRPVAFFAENCTLRGETETFFDRGTNVGEGLSRRCLLPVSFSLAGGFGGSRPQGDLHKNGDVILSEWEKWTVFDGKLYRSGWETDIFPIEGV